MAKTTHQSKPFWKKISIAHALMYGILIFYAAISIMPFIFMLSTSLMTLGEATSGRILPRSIDTTNDISPCILYTNDTFVNESGETVTQNRLVIDVPPEVEKVQGYGNRAPESFVERNEIFRIPFITNYCQAWKGGNLGHHIWVSVKITAITVAGTVIFATLTAYAFARMNFIGKNVLFGILLATLMIPGIVQNLPNFLLVNEIGKIFGANGWFATTLGFSFCGTENCWINNWPALTIPFMAPAISIFLLRQHFASIPYELWDAAQIDGAGHVRFLIQVVLPLSKAALFVVVLFAFIGAWNELAWPLLVTVGSDEWRPIAVGLQSFFNEEANFPHLRMAGSMIAILPILILYAFTQRTFIEGLSQSGLKG